MLSSSVRRPVSARISYVYNHFYSDYMNNLQNDLLRIADSICVSLDFHANVKYYVSMELMEAVVKSITLDIIKYKDFHFTDATTGVDGYKFTTRWMKAIHKKNISASKHASFLAKWIVRHSPITILVTNSAETTADDLTKIEIINALFAQHVAFKYAEIDERRITEEQVIDVIYHLRFRDISERHFFHWFETLRKVNMTNLPKKTYNVFVASPSDCDNLRIATEEILEQISSMYSYPIFNTYMWEKDKRPGYVGDNYQEQVYEEAKRKWNGGDCDILILFAWKEFGSNTVKEYNWFIEHIVDNSLNKEKYGKKLLFCQYNKPILPTEKHKNIDQLIEWIESIQDNIAPLGGQRDSINSEIIYKNELRKALGLHINRE